MEQTTPWFRLRWPCAVAASLVGMLSIAQALQTLTLAAFPARHGLATLPLLVLFILLSRQLIYALTAAAVK